MFMESRHGAKITMSGDGELHHLLEERSIVDVFKPVGRRFSRHDEPLVGKTPHEAQNRLLRDDR